MRPTTGISANPGILMAFSFWGRGRPMKGRPNRPLTPRPNMVRANPETT
ncbi:hypothetical protein ES707_09021 [subsurface metagenome]